MQKQKTFLTSKINWIAIALIITAVIPMINESDFTSVNGWMTFIFGVSLIIVRTYFTSKPVIKRKTKKQC
jgi:cell division protein FtsW (lipid II flippase)